MAALIAHIMASNQQNAQAMQMLAMSNNALQYHMDPSNPENRLADVKHLSSLAMKPDENVSAYMLNVRILSNRLSSVSIDALMPLFAISISRCH